MKPHSTPVRIIAFLLCAALTVSDCFAQGNGSVKGVGVVVKKNPCCPGRSVTNESGTFTLEMEKASYDICLEESSTTAVITQMIRKADPKSTYVYNGDGTTLTIKAGKGYTVDKGTAKNGFDNVARIVVQDETVSVTFKVSWNSDVMKKAPPAPEKGQKYVGKVTLVTK